MVRIVTDETKDAFRLAGWVLRRGWPGIETVVDDFYDFTAGAEAQRRERGAPRSGPRDRRGGPGG